jgi:preprotein translocase subunit SecF
VLEIVNLSINETMSRTIITSGTTLMVVVALYLFGGPLIHGFALALIVGIMTGTYSSIYVATASAVMLGISRADLAVPKKEVDELQSGP